jgi:putative ABC transport system permease protein
VSRPIQSRTEDHPGEPEMNNKARSATSLMARPSSALAQEEERQSALASMLQQFSVKRSTRGTTLGASFGSAFEALWGNRTRSFLTMLGIFIGVAAVVASMTLTESVSVYFTNIIEGLGANTILIQPGTNSNRGVVSKQTQQTLTVKDVQSIEKINHVTAVSPAVVTRTQVVYQGQNWKTSVWGVSSSFASIEGWEVNQGVWFSDADDTGAQSVAVLGDTVAKNLFGSNGVNPIGQKIRVGQGIYRIIGTLTPKGGFNQDDVIYIPFHTAMDRFGFRGTPSIDGIQLQVDNADNVDVTNQAVIAALEQNHHIRAGQPDDFQIITSAQLLQQVQQETAIISVLLVGVAAISLTVGGIGIMNIMLVSVTQRTREIGIRMSIGARKRDIRNQFLVESLVLCLLGGGIGLLGGMLAGGAMASGFGMPVIISAVTLITPFVVSTGIALVFGIYPAVRASRLDPVVALRKPK